MSILSPKTVVAAILAGGEGRRLGGVAKATLRLGGLSLLERQRAALTPQAAAVLVCIGANQIDAPWADNCGLPVVADPVADAGPLAGIAAALVWTRAYRPEAAAVVSVPVDLPFIPADLVARLTVEDGVAVAESGGRTHHAVAAWPLAVADDLLATLARGEHALHRWQARHPLRVVSWPAESYDPFLNVNTREDLAAAEAIAARLAAAQPRRFA